MTLKEELEILRGEPIQVFTGDPKDIPCIETSDTEKLCKHPVVSVNMITYNHEPYIRQAIEGVMMQQTDFEFELVIGEDASTDRTREICFEYQKKHPDKIRVLWWHENLYRNPHPAGGNGRRVSTRCRGEFIAYCEGDDYWTNPLKLQKQVDVLRKYDSAGFCACGFAAYVQTRDRFVPKSTRRSLPSGLVEGRRFLQWNVFGRDGKGLIGEESVLQTAGVMVRRRLLEKCKRDYEAFDWRLMLGDVLVQMALASISDVVILREPMAVYRIVPTGACGRLGAALWRDNLLVRFYFMKKVLGIDYWDMPWQRRADFAFTMLKAARQDSQHSPRVEELSGYYDHIHKSPAGAVFAGWRLAPIVFCLKKGLVSKPWYLTAWFFAFGMNGSYVCDYFRRHLFTR